MAFMPNMMGGLKTPTFVTRQQGGEDEDKKLQNDALSAVQLVKMLTTVEEDTRTETKSLRMPKAMVKASQALAFVSQTKAGVGLGLTIGSGFVVKRLGPGRWSAPAYFTLKNVSAGLTLGFETVESVICIKDEASLERFIGNEFILGTDVMLQLSMDAFAKDKQSSKETKTWGSEKEGSLATFTLADGAGIDFSLKGGVTGPDTSTNHDLFGQEATPAKLLSGDITPPPAFSTLYDTLNRIEADAEM